MMEAEEIIEEPKANPYNAKKDWHTPIESSKEDANGLFFENPQATSNEAPEETEKPKQKRINYKKRYDDLKRHHDSKIAEFKQREQELVATNQPTYQAPRSPEELEQFKQQYPDLYDTVETIAHSRSSEQVEQLQNQVNMLQQREQEIVQREAIAELQKRHPDFEEIRSDEEFHEWAKLQPEDIQDWIYANPDNAGLASRAIDLYKMEKGLHINVPSKSSKRPAKQATAADMVSTKTTTVDAVQPEKIWTQREIAQMSMAEYDRNEQEIDRAIQEGRVR